MLFPADIQEIISTYGENVKPYYRNVINDRSKIIAANGGTLEVIAKAPADATVFITNFVGFNLKGVTVNITGNGNKTFTDNAIPCELFTNELTGTSGSNDIVIRSNATHSLPTILKLLRNEELIFTFTNNNTTNVTSPLFVMSGFKVY